MSINNTLYNRVKAHGLPIRQVAEVGVYSYETSNVLGFLQDGLPVLLVEADPRKAAVLKGRLTAHPQATLHSVAVAAQAGEILLYDRDSSSFIAGLPNSPAQANDGYTPDAKDGQKVPAVTFDTLDPGNLDLLSVDIEGAEWFVLQHLRSRPLVLSLEMGWKHYKNPFSAQILEWTQREGYVLWYREGSDRVFVKQGLVKLSPWQNFLRSLKGLPKLE